MGVAGALDDFGDITVNVYTYAPTITVCTTWPKRERMGDGRVSPLSIQDNDEFRPFREMSLNQTT